MLCRHIDRHNTHAYKIKFKKKKKYRTDLATLNREPVCQVTLCVRVHMWVWGVYGVCMSVSMVCVCVSVEAKGQHQISSSLSFN